MGFFFFFILFLFFSFILVVLFMIIIIFFFIFLFFFFIHQCGSSHNEKQPSSSSLTCPSTATISQREYDVFLSFRGEDTRNKFISHLYPALCQKNIQTFIDHQIEKGDEISPSLLRAIRKSKIAVVIFSEGYASSTWCLEELVEILECKKMYGQIVIPIFYGVNPSNVRYQTGNFGDALLKLEERYKEREEKLQKWRNALTEAANLSGFVSQMIRSEYALIEEIVENILKRPNDMFQIDRNAFRQAANLSGSDSQIIRSESALIDKIVENTLKRLNDIFQIDLKEDMVGIESLNDMFQIDFKEELVGVESRMEEIKSLLNYGSMYVNTFGIWGIRGTGNTTIASAIFCQISSHFEVSCLILNVREEAQKYGGLAHLRWQLHSTSMEDEMVKCDTSYVIHIKSFDCCR